MHRQSLGSPEPQKQSSEGEEGVKKVKPRSSIPETYIHLIPILTLLCFLILYLSSHDPSLNDLAHFNTFFNPPDELQQVGDIIIKKGDILAIRSLKNLPHAAKHRKLARQKLV